MSNKTIKRVILTDYILCVWLIDGHEVDIAYHFDGSPVKSGLSFGFGGSGSTILIPNLPEWVLSMAESHVDSQDVVITEVQEFGEDDFDFLLKRARSRSKLIQGIIQTPDRSREEAEHIVSFFEDYMGRLS